MEKLGCNVREAAKIMGVCKGTVEKLIREGHLKAKRPSPRRIVIPVASINEYLKGNDFDRS